MATGTVVGVSSKETHGVKKLKRAEVTLVAGHGVEGDYHAGEFVRHRSRAATDPQQPNRRQVHIMNAELFDELALLGISVTPGDMGENITTRGVPILDLPPGTLLYFGASAIVEITGCRNPCAQLNDVDAKLLGQVAQKAADGTVIRKAGIMGIVRAGGIVRPGDAIGVEVPEGATGRLQPI
jgi:MOSC domain-containing protein YiiM